MIFVFRLIVGCTYSFLSHMKINRHMSIRSFLACSRLSSGSCSRKDQIKESLAHLRFTPRLAIAINSDKFRSAGTINKKSRTYGTSDRSVSYKSITNNQSISQLSYNMNPLLIRSRSTPDPVFTLWSIYLSIINQSVRFAITLSIYQ